MSALLTIRSERAQDDKEMGGLIGRAPAFRAVVSKLPTLAKAKGSVLISGETGTGKELVARAVHELSPRAQYPFIPVNCGALVDTLLESELFGHERGAFTDAHARRQGLISQAARGTLFLDELDTMSPRAQVGLLRFLQDRTFRALGSAVEQQADVRFVAATNTRLDGLVKSGAFRADLYYRVSVLCVTLPPLRERREDILPLAEHFVAKHGGGVPVPLSGAAVEALLAWDWPGNVRELEGAVMRALAVASTGQIEPGDLDVPATSSKTGAMPLLTDASSSYKIQKRRVIDCFERQYLMNLMTVHQGNVSQAAQAAGKERRDLGKLLKRHGLNARLFAPGVDRRAATASCPAKPIVPPADVAASSP